MARGGGGGGGGDVPTEYIDALCAEIADNTIGEAIGLAESSPANAGQETLVLELPIYDQWELVFNGEEPYVETGYYEVIGIIVGEVNEILATGAKEALLTRETTTWADVK